MAGVGERRLVAQFDCAAVGVFQRRFGALEITQDPEDDAEIDCRANVDVEAKLKSSFRVVADMTSMCRQLENVSGHGEMPGEIVDDPEHALGDGPSLVIAFGIGVSQERFGDLARKSHLVAGDVVRPLAVIRSEAFGCAPRPDCKVARLGQRHRRPIRGISGGPGHR